MSKWHFEKVAKIKRAGLVVMSLGIVALGSIAHAKAPDQGSAEREAVLKVVAKYHAALEARSREGLAAVVDPEFIIFEGIYKNIGWADYRDNHIGPEMDEWTSFRVKNLQDLKVEIIGKMAYVLQELQMEIVTPKDTVALTGAETFILTQGAQGWRIKHLHSSAKKVQPSPQPSAAK